MADPTNRQIALEHAVHLASVCVPVLGRPDHGDVVEAARAYLAFLGPDAKEPGTKGSNDEKPPVTPPVDPPPVVTPPDPSPPPKEDPPGKKP